jgi:hypothetical protein
MAHNVSGLCEVFKALAGNSMLATMFVGFKNLHIALCYTLGGLSAQTLL